MPSSTAPVPDVSALLNTVPDQPASVLESLEQHPSLASQQDQNGYSLLHAAASYGHVDLVRRLVREHGVSVNIADQDGDTPLFYTESIEVAKCLVEELGADTGIRNSEGESALDKMKSDNEFPEVIAYLESRSTSSTQGEESARGSTDPSSSHPPPPLPPNIRMNLGTMEESLPPIDGASGIGHEFRQRIEELAAREDFQSEEAQAELRQLVSEALQGLTPDSDPNVPGGKRQRSD